MVETMRLYDQFTNTHASTNTKALIHKKYTKTLHKHMPASDIPMEAREINIQLDAIMYKSL